MQVTPSAAASTNVSGTATLTGATVNAQFAPGNYVSKKYTILTAAGGLGGTTFAGVANSNLPQGASDNLSYDANNVYLNLKAGFTTYTGLNVNQQNVANALNNVFNSGGTLPPAFAGLFGLTAAIWRMHSQLDGEAATGAERAAFQLTNEFLNLMLDPFVNGRANVGGVGGGAIGFAPEEQASCRKMWRSLMPRFSTRRRCCSRLSSAGPPGAPASAAATARTAIRPSAPAM